MTIIGLFGLIMAVLGIYGVVSNSAIERTHELGVRRALGSSERDILLFIINKGMKPTLVGLGAGMFMAVGVMFGISQLLFSVSSLDPATYLLVGLILLCTALIASFLPARKAARIDPMEALRYE